MELGVIGLGRMGGNIVKRLQRAGHATVGYARRPEAVAALTDSGMRGVRSLADLVEALAAPRAIWLMVPAAAVESTLAVASYAEGLNILRHAGIGGASAAIDAETGEKMRFEQLGGEGWLRVVASGILANWLVGMAAFLATGARTVSGKILGIALPILAFVALGVQHVPANMGYFAAGLIHGGAGTTVPEAFVWNLLPATLGNLIGGTVLVSLLFWYVFGDGAKRASLARANDHVQATRPHG